MLLLVEITNIRIFMRNLMEENMKRCITIAVSLCLMLTMVTPVFASSADSKASYAQSLVGSTNNDVSYYLDLVEEYQKSNPNASVTEINSMLKKELTQKPVSTTSQAVRARGASDYLPTSVVELSAAEKKVFDSNPYYGLLVLTAGKAALDTAQAKYSTGLHNGNGDAFRHSYWNCLSSYLTTTSYAKKFSDAHEAGTSNPALEHTMDYYNNQKGRDFYTANASTIGRQPSYARTEYICNLILSKVDSGNMKRYSGSSFTGSTLVPTDKLGRK